MSPLEDDFYVFDYKDAQKQDILVVEQMLLRAKRRRTRPWRVLKKKRMFRNLLSKKPG